jgi:hypothetical protein
MGYVQRSLAPGERIVYRTKLHPVIFVWPSLFILASVAAFVTEFLVAAWVFLAVAAAAGFVILRICWRSEFAVTNRRIFGKIRSGADPEYEEVALIEVQDAVFQPGVLGRVFDYGAVIITDKQGRTQKFSGVPKKFYDHVQTRDERVRRILR